MQEQNDPGRLRPALVPHVKSKATGQLTNAGKQRVPDADLTRLPPGTALVWGRHDRFVPLRLAERAHHELSWPLRVLDAPATPKRSAHPELIKPTTGDPHGQSSCHRERTSRNA